jgi:DMSO/TMAO reductase YedYZ molybdopterin-dependent catalytic subunit
VKKKILGLLLTLILLLSLVPVLPISPVMAAGPSTTITMTKYANDDTTILAQTTVDYEWMEDNLTPYGDGAIEYYHQGPTFDSENLWDPGETVTSSIDSRNYGAAVGSSLLDLCDEVGGAPAGSEIEVKATDNFYKRFATDDLNNMGSLGITPVIAWYNSTYGGYVPDYDTGMRLIFFDDNTNGDGKHVFGNGDMHETLAEAFWHYYDGIWPSSSGLSVQNVDRINIYTDEEPPVMDVLYDGTVNLPPGGTFDVTSYYMEPTGTTYTVSQTTPLGALDAAATLGGFTYVVSDKKMASMGILLLDDVDVYMYDSPGEWYAYVNDTYIDGFADPADGLNVLEVVNDDTVEYYYAAGVADPSILADVQATATAAVKTVVSTGVTPTDWTLELAGATETSITKAYFEEGLACPDSGHYVEWTDDYGDVWGGVPLWLLVAMVDDDPDVGPYHFNFNDDLAAQNYEVNVIAGDGWSATLDSAAIARSDGYIVASTLNGEELPLQTESGKPCWPLYLKGSEVFGGQQVGNIVRIELSGLPEPPEGWTLEMVGEVGDTIAQSEFEEGLACPGSDHYREWTDIDDNVWSGVPLWVLLGTVDDIETTSHWTFNDDVAATDYTITVIAGDGYSRDFYSIAVARSDGYIVANEFNGEPLVDSWPLRLVGDGVTKADGSLGGSAVGNIVKIEIPELQTPEPEPGSWNLALAGKITDVISQAEFEAALVCPGSNHYVEWTDIDDNVWSGMPLWFLAGWVDDRLPHDYNFNQAMAGYTVLVKAEDGYTKDFASADVAMSNDYIIANQINGEPLADAWPLRLVGDGVAKADGSLGGSSVGNIAEIELTDFETALPIPEVRIIKYDTDRVSILDEVTVDYLWMKDNRDVIGDGTTVYKYEAITNDPDDVWDAAETYPGGFKIENAVKGTRVRDLCDLVGGMGDGTEIKLIASDGYETTLPYSSIYTDPAVQECQGDAILAWWGDGEYVPYYADGMRLFFTPDGDHVYGQWDMHETLTLNYWHYYWNGGVQYPSCAGLSAKWITTIEIHSVPESNWTLVLDGQDVGGLYYEVSKTYFEQALACQFGANHKATYTDGDSNVWEGMPLWFLAGFVDDDDQHSDNAFNDDLAIEGYDVVITAADGYSVTLDSQDIIRSSDYIVANSVNGAHIPDTDEDWPLRLVGAGVTGSQSISQIVRIELESHNVSPGGGGSGIDRSPPRISNVSSSDITKTSATIYWATHERGTSRVEYWASPHLFSELDEELVREHAVNLTGLTPGTTYHYQTISCDKRGNEATSDESTFTTLGTPATFTLSNLSVSPTEVDIGEAVTVSVLVTNTGDATGTYQVALNVDEAAEDTKEVTLAGGTSQTVTFTVARDVEATYSVNINGEEYGTFVVKSPAGAVAEITGPTDESTEPAPEQVWPTQQIIWWIVGGIVAICVAIGLYIVVRRRRGIA